MKELNRRATRRDSETPAEVPDFLFNYADSDSLGAEIAEWYTYSEEPEFLWNMNAFKTSGFQKHYSGRKWTSLSEQEKKSHIVRLLDQIEISNKTMRDDSMRSILYLAQGTFGECETIDAYYKCLVENVVLLYECDTFSIFLDLLMAEIELICNMSLLENKYASCITDNADARVILSVLYTILEVVRSYESETSVQLDDGSWKERISKIKKELKTELNTPLPRENELLSSYLFQLIAKFCNQNVIVLPIKKIILLLWKVLLLTLGSLDDAFRCKNEMRKKFNLSPIVEDPSTILSKMTPATPPPNPIDLANELQASSVSSVKRKKNNFETNGNGQQMMNGLTKQQRGIDSDDLTISNASTNNSGRVTQFAISSSSNSFGKNDQFKSDSNGNSETSGEDMMYDGDTKLEQEMEQVQFSDASSTNDVSSNHTGESTTDRSGSPPPERMDIKSPPPLPSHTEQSKLLDAANDAALIKLQLANQLKSLPWKPKVRLAELEAFLDQERKKFFGFGDLPNDLNTMIGLPYPIQESVRILKQHMYTSLSEEQIKMEENITKYPLSTKEQCLALEDSESPSEIFFSSVLNQLPQYLICLLKILLTSVPQTRPKTDSLQIMSDLFPEDLSGSHFFTVKLSIDSNRHREILIKAISAILLLLLKHLKANHVYQFEFVSQHLLFANCIPLILKFFNLNMSTFIQSKNNHMALDFPSCVIGTQPEIDAEELENGDAALYRWRNVFSCINLLRILNKITKSKRSRIVMLVIFKSAPILKKILRIKQIMLQYYALKLLKMQTKHLGRQWRKTNMSTMSAIYQKVRHRLNDDWAFGNELETQGWDFQSEECALRAKIDKYIQRKYKVGEEAATNGTENGGFDFSPVDNSLLSCLKTDVKLPDEFVNNYQQWLDDEIFANKIDWDMFLKQKQLASDANAILF